MRVKVTMPLNGAHEMHDEEVRYLFRHNARLSQTVGGPGRARRFQPRYQPQYGRAPPPADNPGPLGDPLPSQSCRWVTGSKAGHRTTEAYNHTLQPAQRKALCVSSGASLKNIHTAGSDIRRASPACFGIGESPKTAAASHIACMRWASLPGCAGGGCCLGSAARSGRAREAYIATTTVNSRMMSVSNA